jgi:predicted HTH domain antitoxin
MRVRTKCVEVTLQILDEVARQLGLQSVALSRHALEALAIDGYRKQTLSLYQIGQMLGLTRIEMEDFLGQNQVPLADMTPADLDRSAGRVTDETDYFRLADDSPDWSRIKPKRTTAVNYSYFRATTGSTRIARRAGM